MASVLDRPLRWTGSIDGVDSVVLRTHGTETADRRPVVIFDGDDTLWATEQLYDEARANAAHVVSKLGVDPAAWEELQRKTDVGNVTRFGLLAERFPTSSVEAFEFLRREAGAEVTADEASAVRQAAASVFERRAPVDPHASDVLSDLRQTHRLILLTQGDPRVQTKRVRDSGLAEYFDEIVVVAAKSASVLAAVVDHFGIPPQDSWMVGNSLPSDINPAVAAGMRAIWIDAHVWSHERREARIRSGRVVQALGLEYVPEIVRPNHR